MLNCIVRIKIKQKYKLFKQLTSCFHACDFSKNNVQQLESFIRIWIVNLHVIMWPWFSSDLQIFFGHHLHWATQNHNDFSFPWLHPIQGCINCLGARLQRLVDRLSTQSWQHLLVEVVSAVSHLLSFCLQLHFIHEAHINRHTKRKKSCQVQPDLQNRCQSQRGSKKPVAYWFGQHQPMTKTQGIVGRWKRETVSVWFSFVLCIWAECWSWCLRSRPRAETPAQSPVCAISGSS